MDQRLVIEFQSRSNTKLLDYAYQPGVFTNDVVLVAQHILLGRTLNKEEED